jgi:hypothetical protein
MLLIPRPQQKAVQETGEAFSSQKRTSSTSKDEIYKLFTIFLGPFCPPGSGSELRIRIQEGFGFVKYKLQRI